MRTSLSVLSGLALVATACLSPGGQAADPRLIEKRQAGGFNQPNSWLTTIPASNLGEPLNVIISSQSSPEVLSDEGLASYLSSLFFSPNNCLGITLGDKQAADLNDGQGAVNQTALYRYNFNMGTTTCQESINGGPHVRYWKQTTTGAIFLAASIEMSASKNHQIVADGYDNGRDWFVGNATNSSGTTSPQDASQYKATSTNVQASIDDASVNHGISTDGNVAVLTVTRTKAGNGTNPTASSSSAQSTGGSSSSDAHSDAMHSSPWLLLACMAMCTALITTPSALAFPVKEEVGLPRRAAKDGSSTRADSRRDGKSSDPAVAEGQMLSNSTEPDPLPTDSSLFSKTPTAAIDGELRSRINTVSPFAQAPYCHSVQNGTWGGAGCGDACASVPGQVDLLWTAGDGGKSIAA